MRALARPLVAVALAGAALSAVPAQAAAPAPAEQWCPPVPNCDLFWLFRACGPLVKCP